MQWYLKRNLKKKIIWPTSCLKKSSIGSFKASWVPFSSRAPFLLKLASIIPLLFLIIWTPVWLPEQIVLTFAGFRALYEQSHSIHASATSFFFFSFIQSEVPVIEPCWSCGSFIFTGVNSSVCCPWTRGMFPVFCYCNQAAMDTSVHDSWNIWAKASQGYTPGVEVPAYMV